MPIRLGKSLTSEPDIVTEDQDRNRLSVSGKLSMCGLAPLGEFGQGQVFKDKENNWKEQHCPGFFSVHLRRFFKNVDCLALPKTSGIRI